MGHLDEAVMHRVDTAIAVSFGLGTQTGAAVASKEHDQNQTIG